MVESRKWSVSLPFSSNRDSVNLPLPGGSSSKRNLTRTLLTRSKGAKPCRHGEMFWRRVKHVLPTAFLPKMTATRVARGMLGRSASIICTRVCTLRAHSRERRRSRCRCTFRARRSRFAALPLTGCTPSSGLVLATLGMRWLARGGAIGRVAWRGSRWVHTRKIAAISRANDVSNAPNVNCVALPPSRASYSPIQRMIC